MTVLQTISFCTVSALMKKMGGFFCSLKCAKGIKE